MEDNMVPEEPKVETAVEETPTVETQPVVNEVPKNDIVFNDKPKKNSGMMMGMIVLLILAIGGIGFGIWGMMGKDQAEKDLAIRVREASGTVTEVETDKIVRTDEDGNVTEITDKNAVDSEDYIYVGEWGMKIKIPEGLEFVTYKLDYNDNMSQALFVSGATTDGQAVPDFGRVSKCDGLGVVTRYSEQRVQAGAYPGHYGDKSWFMIKDGYYYHFDASQALCTQEEGNGQWEDDSRSLIMNMLSHSENYSKI